MLTPCQHTHHFLIRPFCRQQPLVVMVATYACYLILALALYFASRRKPPPVEITNKTIPIDLQIVNSKFKLWDEENKQHWLKFREVLIKNSTLSWGCQEVMEAANTYMEYCYNQSLTILDYLVEQQIKLTQLNSTGTEVLCRCGWFYHSIIKRRYAFSDGKSVVILQETEFSSEYAHSFYKKGTPQKGWRLLYNNYCQKIRKHFSKEELIEKEKSFSFAKPPFDRYANWTEEDIGT